MSCLTCPAAISPASRSRGRWCWVIANRCSVARTTRRRRNPTQKRFPNHEGRATRQGRGLFLFPRSRLAPAPVDEGWWQVAPDNGRGFNPGKVSKKPLAETERRGQPLGVDVGKGREQPAGRERIEDRVEN